MPISIAMYERDVEAPCPFTAIPSFRHFSPRHLPADQCAEWNLLREARGLERVVSLG